MHDDSLPIPAQALGQRIAALRRAGGWSQRQLAESAGVSHGYIALLELGRLPSPGKFRLDAVARALNLRTSDSLTGPALRSASTAAEPSWPASARQDGESAAQQGSESGVRASNSSGPRPSRTPVDDDRPAGGMARLAPLAARLAQRTFPHLSAGGVGAMDATAASAPVFAAQVADEGARRLAGSRASGGKGGNVGNVSDVRNVVGAVDQVRGTGARPLPVFRWGACGDPRDQESPPDPDHLEYPPPGRETLIGPNGFGVVVKGDSMAARGIFDGDVVWVNPDRPYGVGKVVLALVSDVGGDDGMVVKTYARTEVGDCLLSETVTGRSPVVCREFKIIGPVVGITSWRLPN